MPRGMRLRVCIEWEDGEQVVADGKKLEYKEADLLAAVESAFAWKPDFSWYTRANSDEVSAKAKAATASAVAEAIRMLKKETTKVV